MASLPHLPFLVILGISTPVDIGLMTYFIHHIIFFSITFAGFTCVKSSATNQDVIVRKIIIVSYPFQKPEKFFIPFLVQNISLNIVHDRVLLRVFEKFHLLHLLLTFLKKKIKEQQKTYISYDFEFCLSYYFTHFIYFFSVVIAYLK